MDTKFSLACRLGHPVRIAVCFVLIVAVLGIISWYLFGGWSHAKVGQVLAASIKSGATRSEVEKWLDSRGFTNRYYRELPEELKSIQHSEELFGPGSGKLSGFIVVSIPGRYVRPFHQEMIDVQFFFDKDDRLVGYFVDSVVMSP